MFTLLKDDKMATKITTRSNDMFSIRSHTALNPIITHLTLYRIISGQ